MSRTDVKQESDFDRKNLPQKQHCKQLHADKLYNYREDYAIYKKLWISLRGPEKTKRNS